MPDDFDVYGTWKLENFPEAVTDWQQSGERPPFKLVADINAWWPRLEHRDEWVGRAEQDPDTGIYVMWATGCYLMGKDTLLGVLCFFELDEIGHRVICKELHLAADQRPPRGFGE